MADGQLYQVRVNGQLVQVRAESAEQARARAQQAMVAQSQPQPDPPARASGAVEGPLRPLSQGAQGFNEGLAQVLGLPVSSINYALDVMGAPVSDEPFMGQNFLRNRLVDVGSINPQDQPRNITERVARRIGEEGAYAAPTALGLGVAARAPQAATSLSRATTTPGAIVRQQVQQAARNPGATAATGAGLTAASGAGAGVGQEVGGDTGELIGQIGAPLAAAGAANVGRNVAARGAQGVTRSAQRLARDLGVGRAVRDNPEALSEQGGRFVGERLGSRGRVASSAVAGGGGPAQDVAETAIADRAGQRAQRMTDAVRQATGMEGRSPVQAIQGLEEVRQAARPLFNQADQQMVRVTPNLRETLRSLQRRGVDFRVADEVARDQGFAGAGLSQYADDIDALPNRLPLGALRALAITAEFDANAAYRASERGRAALAGPIQNGARQVRDFMRRVSPEYREAAGMWASQARDEQAFDIGANVLRPGARAESQLQRFITSGTSESERRMFMAGIADALERRMGNVSAGGNAASPINRQLIRERIGKFLEDADADRLMQAIDAEMSGARFEANVLRGVGSQTASRQEADQLRQRAQAGRGRSFLAELVSDPLEALRARGARRSVAEFIQQGNDEDMRVVAKLLYSTGDASDNPLARALLSEARRRGIDFTQSGATITTSQINDRSDQDGR
jgi:hypothetical protein